MLSNIETSGIALQTLSASEYQAPVSSDSPEALIEQGKNLTNKNIALLVSLLPDLQKCMGELEQINQRLNDEPLHFDPSINLVAGQGQFLNNQVSITSDLGKILTLLGRCNSNIQALIGSTMETSK